MFVNNSALVNWILSVKTNAKLSSNDPVYKTLLNSGIGPNSVSLIIITVNPSSELGTLAFNTNSNEFLSPIISGVIPGTNLI